MLTAIHKTGGVTFRAGDMVVPLYDNAGALVNVQLINSDGLKRTLKGGAVKGACHTIEGKNRRENACGLRRAMRPRSPYIT